MEEDDWDLLDFLPTRSEVFIMSKPDKACPDSNPESDTQISEQSRGHSSQEKQIGPYSFTEDYEWEQWLSKVGIV